MKYSPELEIAIDDFLSSGALEITTAFYSEGVHHERNLNIEFAIAATQAGENKQLKSAKALWLLSYAASLHLKPDSLNDPLRPNYSDISLELFSSSDVVWFSEVIAKLPNCLFKARLAEILWLKPVNKKRDIQYALIAIVAYQTKSLDFMSWIRGGADAWRRACTLALMLKTAATTQLEQLEAALLQGFHFGLTENGWLSIQISRLLFEKGLGFKNAEMIAKELANLAETHFQNADFSHAGDHFEHASEWFERVKNIDQAIFSKMRRAASMACEARARTEGSNKSYLAAHTLYDRAIQAYRDIPNAARATYNVDSTIESLRKTMIEVGERGQAEMHSTPIPIDKQALEKLAGYAVEMVSGKSAVDALIGFVQLQKIADYASLKQTATHDLKNSLTFRIFGGSQALASDGRVIAKNAGLVGLDNTDDPPLSAITAQMIRSHSLHVGISAHSILAALHTLRFEHRLPESFFISLARESQAILESRTSLFGKALFAGYDGDFVVATHLLIPQIENFVRVYLKQIGAVTTSLNRDGVEHENGLSTLIDLPEAIQVFGEDLIFEFRALLCDSNGPNLRNELAHGLLNLNDCQSPSAIYVWWFCLKLVVSSWWNAKAAYKNKQ